MLELLSPAGSPEGIVAAVQNGADAVYLGFGDFNARKNAKNFSEEDFRKAAEYCRVRGVKIYVTLNTLSSDRELAAVIRQAKAASALGADAILVQDLGILKAIRAVLPEMQVHASTQMSIHNLEGVKMAAAMGISRVVLARELSLREIEYICKNSPIEIEVFAHGALCMCYSGQCYMSAVIGRRSGNRGLCAQPCRMAYTTGKKGNDHPLSLKDNCLIGYLKELEKAGVACVKLEGRMKRPEYAAIVTGIYSRAIKSGKTPSEAEMKMLSDAFSRDGFTDGYLTDKHGKDMFGIRSENERANESMFAAAKRNYLHSEIQRVPVQFVAMVTEGEKVRLAAKDDKGHLAMAEGPIPEKAFSKELTKVSLQTQLYKTGGTPFLCVGVKSEVSPGLSLPISAINEMRRTALESLTQQRSALSERTESGFIFASKSPVRTEKPVFTVSITKLSQLSKRLEALSPHTVYIPLEEFNPEDLMLRSFLDNKNINVALTMPRIIHDGEMPRVKSILSLAKKSGVTDVLVGNLGHLATARSLGFNLRGDFGLNVYNSETLKILGEFGLKSAVLSFEMRLEQIRAISKPLDTELIVYGRLPLMITENCIVKSSTGLCNCASFPGIVDKNGFTFPVLKAYGCRNAVFNSQKLFLADRAADYESLGIWGARLMFTTENASECALTAERYIKGGDYSPSGYTRGLYYRGVE